MLAKTNKIIILQFLKIKIVNPNTMTKSENKQTLCLKFLVRVSKDRQQFHGRDQYKKQNQNFIHVLNKVISKRSYGLALIFSLPGNFLLSIYNFSVEERKDSILKNSRKKTKHNEGFKQT